MKKDILTISKILFLLSTSTLRADYPSYDSYDSSPYRPYCQPCNYPDPEPTPRPYKIDIRYKFIKKNNTLHRVWSVNQVFLDPTPTPEP